MFDATLCAVRTDGMWVVACLLFAWMIAIGAYAIGFVQGAQAVTDGQDEP